MSILSEYLVLFFVYFIVIFDGVSLKSQAKAEKDFLVITVATNVTDGYKRFIRSTKVNGLPVQVLGMGQKWEGGDMKYAGGGHKITLLMEALEAHRQKNTIILFTDCYDVIITGSQEDIVKKFEKMNAGIVFGAEANIWPDKTLVDEYPVTESRYKYLNSGGFIGYASDIYNFIKTKEDELDNNIDDQLFYTKLFLDFPTREKYRVMLDYKANIFQNLFDALEDIELNFDGDLVVLENTKYSTVPSVIHGNGIAKVSLNSLSNYVPHGWTMSEGCISCTEDLITLPENESDYPEVLVGVIISQPTPFLEEFFQRLYKLNYPKGKLHLFIYNSNDYHEAIVDQYVETFGKEYKSIKQIKPSDKIAEAGARTLAIKHCEKKSCSYYLNIDSVAHLDNPNTLKFLIQANRSIIAPLLVRPYKAWSNFWGAIQSDGYYFRSFDYLEIVNYKRLGLWNVPYISSAYLINATLLKSIKPVYDHPKLDPDMSFCLNFREKGVFMYVDNRIEYGHLVDPEGFDTSKTHPELYEIIYNKYDWEQRYLHPNYSENLNPNKTVQQPCPDVYWFPIVTERYCDELIEVMETFGKWSSGSNEDERLDGGYENVPTRDIHMKQVNMEPAWLEILRSYVVPIQEHVFTGYYQETLTSIMNFVVRYKPDEQPILRPHHDASTYTINLALNRPKIDYEGGGCKFIRYNCSVIDTKVGWMLMHPGRLTHYHEGLEVKKGTRYIMISFINP